MDHDSLPMPLSDQKLLEEIERLRLENSQLRKPLWKTSAFLLALAGLFVSLLGNTQQYFSGKHSSEAAQSQLQLERERWDKEREKLEVEIQALKQNTQNSAETYQTAQDELSKVNHDISLWDDSIFKLNMQLALEQGNLGMYELQKDKLRTEMEQKIVENIKNTIAYQTNERQQLVLRRQELEKHLGAS